MRSSRRFPVTVHPSFFVLTTFLLYSSEDSTSLFALIFACLIHESGHLMAARSLGLKIDSLHLGLAGLELKIRRNCNYLGDLLLALSGPAASLLLTALLCAVPVPAAALLSGISLILGLFNLLPIRPLDGGEALNALLMQLCSEEQAWRYSRMIGVILVALCLQAGAVLAAAGNPALLILGLWLLACHLRSS
ncbi:MAG: site-2 protease family protein [Oscillospiraceae bacterium]|nr:site-2 protease family protein [Oscillospiraceae bacterium]